MTLLERFEAGEISTAEFDHERHLLVGISLLRKTNFADAVVRYLRGIEVLAAASGAPDRVSVTVTVAYLSIIAELLAREPARNETTPESFLANHSDLRRKDLLLHWYSPHRLHDPLARSLFLLPGRKREL